MANTDIFSRKRSKSCFVPETDLYIGLNHSTTTATVIQAEADFINNYLLIEDISRWVRC